jgi:FkbM family methyltransferase
VDGRAARVFRSGVIRVLRRAGVHLERFPPRAGPFTLVSQILADRGVALVLDVGANRGQWTAALRSHGYRGQVLSFEPDSKAYEALESVAGRDAAWNVIRAAVGSSLGVAKLNAASDSAVSSFLSPTTAYIRRNPGGATARIETVPIVRLDSMSEILTSIGPLFLKSDTQGWDLEVLRGLGSVAERVVAVQVELSVRPIYSGGSDHLEVIEQLRERGFVPAGFFTVDRDASHRLVEYDGVFIRDR